MRYGVWNNVTKTFQFGISEPTVKEAQRKLVERLGKDAYKFRFKIKRITVLKGEVVNA